MFSNLATYFFHRTPADVVSTTSNLPSYVGSRLPFVAIVKDSNSARLVMSVPLQKKLFIQIKKVLLYARLRPVTMIRDAPGSPN